MSTAAARTVLPVSTVFLSVYLLWCKHGECWQQPQEQCYLCVERQVRTCCGVNMENVNFFAMAAENTEEEEARVVEETSSIFHWFPGGGFLANGQMRTWSAHFLFSSKIPNGLQFPLPDYETKYNTQLGLSLNHPTPSPTSHTHAHAYVHSCTCMHATTRERCACTCSHTPMHTSMRAHAILLLLHIVIIK